MQVDALTSLTIIELGAVATILALLFGIYTHTSNNQPTIRDKENELRNLEGKTIKQGNYAITVDNIEIEEHSGLSYRLKQLLLRPVNGTTYTTVRVHQIEIPEDLWDMDHAQIFYEANDFPVKYVNSQVNPSHTALVFELQTTQYPDLKQFLDNLGNYLHSLEESGVSQVHDRMGGQFHL